jgi:hypothetical protein
MSSNPFGGKRLRAASTGGVRAEGAAPNVPEADRFEFGDSVEELGVVVVGRYNGGGEQHEKGGRRNWIRDDKHKAFSGALTVLFDYSSYLVSSVICLYTQLLTRQCGNAK